MNSTNFFFEPGKLSIIMDGGAGSSGKGKIGSYVCENANNFTFACNTFMPQAGHWVRLKDGRTFFYQTLNSCAYLNDKIDKIYIGPGAMIELPAFWREYEENGLKPHQIGISPITSILTEADRDYELGLVDLHGNPIEQHDGTMKYGSTAHGCGAARAKKILRKGLVARDIPELSQFICDIPTEIMNRLDRGEAGLLEIAQGYQLSLNTNMYPYTTSRNCTVAAALDDMMVPPVYAGNVLINFRTYPIRICNYKYLDAMGNHLTWGEVQEFDQIGWPYEKVEYDSGPGYADQKEITWAELNKSSGADRDLTELTSVTKLPRRVFTFSKQNLKEAIRFNKTGGKIYLSLNFVNYLDASVEGKTKGVASHPKVLSWLYENIFKDLPQDVELKFLGTGAMSHETELLE